MHAYSSYSKLMSKQDTRQHFEAFARYGYISQMLQTAEMVLTDTSCRAEFRENAAVDKRDFAAIEYMLRKGRRQLDTYASPGIRDVHH